MAGGDLSLPEANEFSAGQVSLRLVLQLVREHEGDRTAIVEVLRQEYFLKSALKRTVPSERLKQQRTRANNVLIGMKGYGLFNLDASTLTDIGNHLADIDDEAALHEEFAVHILRDRHGIEVLDTVRSLQARGEKVGKESLASELRARNFRLPRATTHHTKLLGWLRKANVLSDQSEIDDSVLKRLTGVSMGLIDEWAGLSQEQKALLRTLRQQAEAHGEGMLPAKEVVDRSEFQHGRIFRDDQLRAKVFRPLEDAGWVRLSKLGPGRGGKSGKIGATKKLIEADLDLLGADLEWGVPADLRPRLNTPLDQIHADLGSSDKHKKGIALELLAVRMAHDLGLTPLRFRERGIETGGAEVDLIAEGAHLHFSRWLFQCKNVSGRVGLSALAKEVGMAVLLRAHVVVVATTSLFADSVREYARTLAEGSHLQAVLIDKNSLAAHREGGARRLTAYFHEAAAETMRVKRAQMARSVEGDDSA